MDDIFNTSSLLDEVFQPKLGIIMDIYLHQRTGRKTLTIIQGFPDTVVIKDILKFFKKTFNTNGCILDKDSLQLQGNWREKVKIYLLDNKIADIVKMHG